MFERAYTSGRCRHRLLTSPPAVISGAHAGRSAREPSRSVRGAFRLAAPAFLRGVPALFKEAPRLVKEAPRLVKEAPRLVSARPSLLSLRPGPRSAPQRRWRHDRTLGRPAHDPRGTCSSLGNDRPRLGKLRLLLVKVRQVPRTGVLPLLSASQFLLGTCSLLVSDRSALVELRHFLVSLRQTPQNRPWRSARAAGRRGGQARSSLCANVCSVPIVRGFGTICSEPGRFAKAPRRCADRRR
jgi:hypothetical protein